MSHVVTLDSAGRLPLPEDLRLRHQLHTGSRLRLDEVKGRILLEPVHEPCPLVERDGLLLINAPLEEPVPDHRQVREERLARLTESAE
jgi:bifunctional DNA-binding transcriptional regulator/antitoxin component of YhaV-PrlF toxin-antitoxin module